MFPTEAWDFAPTLGWEFPPNRAGYLDFWQFSGIGTFLD